MKKIKPGFILALTFATGLMSACNDSSNNPDTARLKQENDSLRAEIDKLDVPDDCGKLIPYADLMNVNVKQGDSVFLNIGMMKIPHKKPLVILWNDDAKGYTDTVKSVNSLGIASVAFSEKRKGDHTVEGIVIYDCGKRKVELPFETTYIVE